MTLSKDARRQNLDDAVLMLMENLCGRSIMESFIDERFLDAGILPTTWEELKARYLVRTTNVRCMYTLSGLGWIHGLKLRDEFDSAEMRELAGRLCAALKDKVKGRRSDEMVSVAELAAETKIPESFIRNAVESNLIEKLFGVKDAEWEDRGKFINIPLIFGMRPL